MSIRAENGFYTAHNRSGLSNRYLFCQNSDTYIMVGDRPVIRLAKRRCLLGTIRFFAESKDGPFPLDEAADITAQWRAGHSRWIIRDEHFSGSISLDVGNPENEHGLILRVVSEQTPVLLRYGGIHALLAEGVDLSGTWSIDPAFEGNYASIPFDEALGGRETWLPADGGFDVFDDALLLLDGKIAEAGVPVRLCVRADFALTLRQHCLEGVIEGDKLFLLTLKAGPQGLPALKTAWKDMLCRADALNHRLEVHTPLGELDMACAYTAEYQNGIWYPPRTMHAPLSWNVPYLGWTNRYGTDVLGWHDRMLQETRYYAEHQHLENDRTGAEPDWTERLGTLPSFDSRFYGRGHVDADQAMYNMQTQFFDQAIHSWRMTGDKALEDVLYPTLKLHLEWYDACFDRGGIYESVIDTWPTDSVWCSGGGSTDATCYAYRAHRAAGEMARLRGDEAYAREQEAITEHILAQFFSLLWVRDKGYPGKYREQGGEARLHENPWIYSAFLPIDTDMLDPIQAAQTVHYARWALENVPSGEGELVYGSSWVPSIWSVRWLGENEPLMMAHAFFKAGMLEDGLRLLKGALGDEQYLYLGSDGARAVLEGLFGYQPDYPHGRVTIAPGMPFDWPKASVRTADVEIEYSRSNCDTRLCVRLTHPAALSLRIPLYATRLTSVSGAECYEIVRGFGRAFVQIELPETGRAEICLRTEAELAPLPPIPVTAEPLSVVELTFGGEVAALLDPQNLCASQRIDRSRVRLCLNELSGEHMLFAIVRHGEFETIQSVHLHLSSTAAQQERFRRLHPSLPASPRFAPLELKVLLRDDVESIYRQRYLSPRPRTISARIGVDGYSPWTFTYWKNSPPEIHLEKRGTLETEDGIPLIVQAGTGNIAFVSRWDNFPTELSIPVNQTASVAVVHLCGTTNPMQCGVENVQLTFVYADGSEESVGLRNPDEFWSLCPLAAAPSAAMQSTHNDYSYETDAFCLPAEPPETLSLGQNCRSCVVRWSLRSDAALHKIRLTALSQEIVIGLLGVTLVC